MPRIRSDLQERASWSMIDTWRFFIWNIVNNPTTIYPRFLRDITNTEYSS